MHACSRLNSPARSPGSLTPGARTLPRGIADRLIGEAALSAYGAVGRAAGPAARLILRGRERKGLEDGNRVGERFGWAGRLRAHGPVIWVHASSIGETSAALPLIDRLVTRGPSILLTTNAVAGFQIAEPRLGERVVHQYAPIDTPAPVDRFLDHWRPDLVLFAESELWPTTLNRLGRRGTPLVLVSARISEGAFRTWGRLGPIARAVLAKLDLVLAQSEADADRYRRLGVRAVQVCGNLKFDVPPPVADEAGLREARAAVGPRQVLLAASTHPGEEAAVLAAHAALSRGGVQLLTVVAPRHPRRGEQVAREVTSAGQSVALRSRRQPICPGTNVYIADTVGEMGLWYRLADVAFLGGSLVARGGQNPIEPAELGVPILHGPNVGNFRAIYGALDEACAAVPVTDATSLAETVRTLLATPAECLAMAERARACVGRFKGTLDRTMEALGPQLARLEGQRCS